MNSYADDLAAVIDQLDLKNAVLVGHSTGGGEVARYIGRRARNDSREVVVDPDARYFGIKPGELSLVASGDASIGGIRFGDWLTRATSST